MSNQLFITDFYYDEEEKAWRQILPQPRRRSLAFDWGGQDDKLWYYIKDGFIRGPREAEEIDALFASNYIQGATLLCVLGAKEWFTYDSICGSEDNNRGTDNEHLAAARDLLKQGDLLAAAFNFGAFVLSDKGSVDPVVNAKPVHLFPEQGNLSETQISDSRIAILDSEKIMSEHAMLGGICQICGCSDSYIKSNHPKCRNTNANTR